ncbi:hypothetical protein EG329_014428 [Mollisiaceae sp. DMI_Dod_QoI]|nr:hypothetical protein EG329_014428 [Helotiales sp. DMI_Dod_QoI]
MGSTTPPPYLQNLSPKDALILSTPASHFTPLSWPTVLKIISSNQLQEFQRRPSDLRRYLLFLWEVRREFGSVMEFILSERLGWCKEDLSISSKGEEFGGREEGERKGKGMFANEGDVKILWNDWPYGLDERIVHLVVWTKFELEEDVRTGDLRGSVRGEIEGFVERVFGRRVGGENVIWFKNWKSLKSVHAVEHFHVMLFDPDPEFVKEVTHGDVPLFRKM